MMKNAKNNGRLPKHFTNSSGILIDSLSRTSIEEHAHPPVTHRKPRHGLDRLAMSPRGAVHSGSRQVQKRQTSSKASSHIRREADRNRRSGSSASGSPGQPTG
jgi:hypothetical protein